MKTTLGLNLDGEHGWHPANRLGEPIGSAEIGWLANRIRERALMVARLPRLDVCADPGDNFLPATAQVAKAEFVVTGDKSGLLLALRAHRESPVVAVTALVTRLDL